MRVPVALVGVVLLSTALGAQIVMQPTPPPQVSAAGTSWYMNQEPIFYAGNFYYPAGPLVHFSPREMAATGAYQGVPLYENKTIEPFSLVFVPIGGGLMRPYERRRAGELAGTSGSVTASFPGETPPTGTTPTSTGRAGGVGTPPAGFTGAAGTGGTGAPPAAVGTSGAARVVPSPSAPRALEPPGYIATIPPPRSNRGIWIMYDGHRWLAGGDAVRFDARAFEHVGEYHGFPVYADRTRDRGRIIYLPVARGMLAPYRRER